MICILFLFLRSIKSQIYSLDENIICDDILCNQGSYLNNIYNYGQEDFGDLTGIHFSFQFFIRIPLSIAGQGFIASIMDADQVVLEIKQKNPNTNTVFEITHENVVTPLGPYQSTNWFYVYITESKLYISEWQAYFQFDHQIQFSSHRFNLFTQSATQYWTGYGCCIIMYKGILVDNTYFNQQLYILFNTKQPETIINLNIQEKVQSKITNDYSDYEHIARLGNQFDYDDKDPYLLNDLLLFNGSQYINIFDVYLNHQYTIEFRLKLSTLTQNIQLFKFQSLNYYISIILQDILIINFDLNGQSSYFELQQQSQLHFCIAIIYYIKLQYTIQLIQFSNNAILDNKSLNQQSSTQFFVGQGTLTIGSSLNQFGSGEYMELYHFRFYQGYFIDDKSVLDPSCQIYLNDRCVICKSPYLLTENNLCQNQCSQQLTTYFSTQHNQCIRQCHTLCATCSDPNTCLSCHGIRQSPPDCFCPEGYFEDHVSPDCRKYFQDVQTQTGQQLFNCLSNAQICQTINFNYPYKTTPRIGLFLIGVNQVLSTQRISLRFSNVNSNYFEICVTCGNNQNYQIHWMSSVSQNFFSEFRDSQPSVNDYLFIISMPDLVGQIAYPQILGWQQLIGSSSQIQIQNQLSNSFEIQSLNNLSFIRYQVIYSNFLSLKYTITDKQSLVIDNIPKSVKTVSLLQGFHTTNSFSAFKLMISSRIKSSLKIYSRLPINELNGWILFTAQQCLSGACDFYESYVSSCNLNFEQCNCNEVNYFVNSNNYCEKCDSSCYECTGLATHCTQCYKSQYKQLIDGKCECQDSQLVNGICVCNPGRFPDLIQQSCQVCHINCKTCFGYASNQCSSCDENKVYNQLISACSCHDSQFLDQNFLCDDCDSSCAQCYSKYDCKTCQNLRILVVNNQTHSCICKPGYFEDDTGNCLQCLIICSECQNQQSCLQCPETRIFDKQKQLCNCIDGYYEISYQQNCKKCPQNCSVCINQNSCLSCDKNSEIYNFQCQCKSGFYYDNECVSCDTDQGIKDKRCNVQVCGDGVHHFEEQCEDGNQLDGDGCNSQCQLESGYYFQNGYLQQIIYPQPYLVENGFKHLYNPQRIFQLYYTQELQQVDIDIEIIIHDKFLNLDYTYFIVDQSYGTQINLTIYVQLLSTFNSKNLEVYFKNPQFIKLQSGVEQNISFISSQISDYEYTDQYTIRLSQNIENSTFYMLYLILGLVVLAILTGGIEIFFNILDLFQIISYLKYINTQLPYNLYQYFKIFSFIQLRIINDHFQIDQYFGEFQNQLHKSPTKIDDDGISPNLIVNLSSYLVIWIFYLTTVMLTNLIPLFMKFIQLDDQQANQKYIQCKINILNIKESIVKSIDKQNQFQFSGFFRTHLSTAYDLSFYLALNLYSLSFEYQINATASYLRLILCLMYFLVLYFALDIINLKSYSLIINKYKYGSLYEGLKLENRFHKYFNLFQLVKRFLFMIFLVLEQPLLQIAGLTSLQILQVVFVFMNPFKDKIESIKQIISEMIMLILEINIFILVIDDYFLLITRPLIGWICIILISLLLISQIIMNATQQWKGIIKIYIIIQLGSKPNIKINQLDQHHLAQQ